MTDFDLVQQRLNLARALQERPDAYARRTKIAQALQKPPGLINADDEIRYDVDHTMQQLANSPLLRQRIGSSSAFATLAHDDLERLANIEHLATLKQERKRREWEDSQPWFMNGALSEAWANIRKIPKAIWANMNDKEAGDLRYTLQELEKAGTLTEEGRARIEADIKIHERQRDDTLGEIEDINRGIAESQPHDMGIGKKMVRGAVTSAPYSLLALGIGALTRNPYLGAVSLGYGVKETGTAEARISGLDYEDAQRKGWLDGTAEAAFEILPTLHMLRFMGRDATQEAAKATLKQFGKATASDVLGENATQIFQDASNLWYGLDPEWEKAIKEHGLFSPESLKIQGERQLVASGAAAITSGAMGSPVFIGKAINKMKRGHQENLNDLNALGENADASKLRQLDPEKFDELLDENLERGGIADLYLDGEVLNQGGLADMLAEAIPEQAQEIRDAIDHGGQVQVKTRDIITRVRDTPGLAAALLPHIRFSAEGRSQAELDSTAEEEIKADLARDVAKMATDEAHQAEVDAVRDDFAAQLDSIGRFTPAVNKIYGTLVASFYDTTAQKLGISAQELMAQRPLHIVGEAVADGLNQAMPDVAALISGAKEKIRNFVQGWRNKQGGKPFVDYLEVNEEAVQEASRHGLDIAGYRHVISDEAVNHIINRHGDQKIETTRAQIALTDADLETIADVVSTPDRRVYGMKTKDGLDIIASIKRMPDGTLSLVEEVRTGRRKLAVKTLRKHVAATDFNRITQVLLSNARSDGNHANIHVVDIDRNHTPAPDNGQDTLQQNKGAPRGAFDPATNTIALLQHADLSTFIHELGHFFFESNIAIANQLIARDNAAGGGTLTDGEKQLINDVDALLAQANLDLDTWNIMTLDQRRYHHETVARQFEAYLMEGKAPVPELQGLFARARAWLFQLYKKLTTLNVQLTDDVRQVFDRMIAGEAAINQARQMRLGAEMLLDADLAGMTADEFKQFQQQFQDATNLALDEMQLRQLADAKAIARLKHKALQNKNKEAQAARGLMEMDARRIIYSQPVYRAWQLLTAKMTPDTTIASRKRAWTDSVEAAHDDLFTAIAKLGGINRQEIESTWGFDPADKIRPVKPGFFVLRKTGGETIDGMKRLLEQYGYLSDQDTLNDFYDLFMEQHRGNSQYSNRHIPDTSSGKAGEGANLQNLPAFRLDYRSLEDMGYSEDQINSLGKKVQKSGGIHPDLLAELILDEQGNAVYGSGDELVLDLMTVPDPKTAVRDLADRMMQQQYSELATPQAIAEAADLAIHNDLTLRLLATEYNALAKAAGKPTLVSRVARQLAQEVIGRTRVRDLNPAKYTRMEGKAARRAFEAAKKGDVALAAAEKRNQLLQAAHAREALEASAEIKKMINYLRRADNQNPKKIDIAYREQIEALLDGYSLRQRSGKALDRRQSLADWVQDQRNQGFEPDIPERLLDDLNRKPWQELTVDELRGLADTVKQIEHIGKTKQELLTARKNKNAKKRIAEMAQAVEDNAPWADRDNRTPVTMGGRVRVWTRNFAADHRRVAMQTRQMDGNVDGGIITDTLVRPANVAGDTEAELTAHAIDYFRQHVVPAYNRKSAQRRAYPLGGKNVSLSDREIFTMLLNWGNEGNRLRLLDGEGWTVAEVEALFAARLTADDARAVQKVWDYYADHTKDKIAAIARRVDGIEPQWVEALAFTFTDASGESVDLQGGYYPIMKDPMRSPTVQAQQEMDMRNGNTGRAAVRDGFTKNRAKRVYGQPLRYDLAGIYQGLGDVIHYIAWREWAVDANRLLGDNEFTRAVMRKYGAEALKQLRSWRDDIISNGNREREGGIQVLSILRQNIALANLGFSSTTAVAQALGLFQSMVRVGHSNILWGTLRYLASPLELTRTARAASTLLQNRGRTQFRELNELRNMVGERSKIRSAASKWGFWLLLKVQGAVDIITWHAQYEKSILNGATDEDAVAQADQAVLDSQGSGMLKDLSAAERGGELKKLLTIHYNYMNTVYNLQYNSLTARNNSVAKKIADVLTLSVLMVIADHALRSLLTPGDDDKWDEDQWYKTIGRDVLAFQFGQFVGLRELTGIINGYGYSGPTGTSPFANMAKLAQQAGQGEADDAFFRALVQAGGSLTGLPSAQINRTMKGARALADDETDNPLALAFGYQK
nr:MAG TPA: crystallin beta/gamma motif-containing protein [Caudoviricetes sp.]